MRGAFVRGDVVSQKQTGCGEAISTILGRKSVAIEQESFISWKMTDNRISTEKKVRRLDFLPLSHLVALIRGARAVVFPSLYEGFGLPVLESMLALAPLS